MAQFHLFSVLVHTPPSGSSFLANDVIDTYWDDTTSAIVVKKNDAVFTGSAGAYFGEQGTNYHLARATSYEGEYAVAGYSFCSGLDLKWFRMLTYYAAYPYAELVTTADSPVCDSGGGAVCDIRFVGAPVIAHSTDKSTGGSISFEVASSNGTVKYSLRDFNYATSGTAAVAGMNTISGIIPGNWTLYIKDTNDCKTQLSFKILFKPAEAEHYRFSWATVPIGTGTSYDARLRIYEREYVGDLVEIDNGEESPFRLTKPRIQGHLNDKLFPIHPTSAVLSLISEQDYQFLPLFTLDNKKFRCVYEIDTGSGFTEIWQGFIMPSVYREDFTSTPYSVEIQITDNVRSLEKELFTDDDGGLLGGSMNLIKVITHIMKRTGLSLKIRSGVNIYETNHAKTATDDPLAQTYVDVSCYRDGSDPFTCWEVLEAILRPFGARIVLSDNQWLIEEIDRSHEGYNYRVFDTSGVYESNSTYDPVIDVKGTFHTDRAVLVDEDHSLEVIPAYGKIDVTSKLNYIGSIVAGGFEKEDLLAPDSEVFSQAQGIYTSEEGFGGWTLRLNGTTGVSFGRVLIGRRGDSSRTGLKDEKDLTRSVGAFFYNAGAWSGNLRNSYIESAAKPYQYNSGDELNFRFEYSTPAKPEYTFMTLRFLIKLGTQYLQQDLTWGASEHIYRAYPPVTNSLQEFELGVPLPDTSVLVDTTIQVRIYFYASEFYDYGLPPSSDDADGSDGLTDMRALTTTDKDYDYRLERRHHLTVGAVNNHSRVFYEMRYATDADAPDAGVVHPNDHNATNNPKIWWAIGRIIERGSVDNRRGVDRKFYLDNIVLDALINGQPPPSEDSISLSVSKYINENLELELYNFDLPDITNGKNMYNNYFRLSDGAPTSLWARSGIDESLPIQKILLKVLGANHSAPTFRITGTFLNEFQRIGVKNYIRITKPGSSLSAINTEFTTDLDGWNQRTVDITDAAFAWTADNSGSAAVTLTGAVNSKQIYQQIDHNGGYIKFTVNVKAVPTSGNTREDVLHALFFDGSKIIHTEKMFIFSSITADSSYDFTHTAFAPGQVTRIGFFFKNAAGSGTCAYQVSKFLPEGTDVKEVYQIADYQSNEIMNEYFLELMQQSKSYISLGGIDTGGSNQSGSTTGREHSSAYSSAYS